jgi:tRNA U54 and U55 pseudouridine synthase Pus10
MLTDKDRAQLLRDAMELLQDADALIQKALGACDVCEETHNRIEDIVEDLRCDVMELDNA